MFVDKLQMPNEARLNQILHTLEHVHQFVFESFEPQLLQTLEQQYSAAKATIVETSAFNSYHANPEYVKASLITEALRLLTEIAPSRRKKNIKESTQHKDPTMTKLNEKAKKAKPDFLDVDKDGDRKESFKKALADKKRAKVDEATNDDEDIEKAKAEFFKKGRQVTYGNPRVAKGASFHRGKFSGHLDKTGSSQADAPGMSVTSVRQKPKIYEDQNLDQAETLLAAKDLSDRLQDMAEDAAKMAVDRLMPLVDTMKGQFGQPAAEGFNQVVKDNLQKVLDTIIAAKDQTDNAILTLQGGGTPEMASDISQPLPAEPGAAAPEGEEGADIDFDKEFDAMASTSGPEQEPLGRAKKSELDEASEKCMECGSGMYETHKNGHMICNECGSRMVAEKIEGGVKTHAARAGMFKDWNMGELRSELAKVKKRMTGYKDRDEKVPHKLRTRFSQLTFAIRAKTGWGKVEEALNSTDQKKQEELAHAAAEQMIKTRKSPDGKPATPQQMADAKKMVAEAKKAKSPYAVGMAKAMELTGDKPPLKKSTIKKAHEIARGVEKNLEEQTSINALNITIRSLSEEFEALRQQFLLHQNQFKSMVTEGQAVDPLSTGYGLEGAALLQQMKLVRSRITEAVENRKRIQAELNETALYRRDVRNKIANLDLQLTNNPYGVAGITSEGRRVRKFFESESHRNMWIDLNKSNLREYQEIDPALIQQIKQKLKNQL